MELHWAGMGSGWYTNRPFPSPNQSRLLVAQAYYLLLLLWNNLGVDSLGWRFRRRRHRSFRGQTLRM